MRSRHSSSESDNSCCRVPPDALHTHLRACPPSLHGCLSGAMAAPVSLACSLSGDTKLCGDLRPADPEVDGTAHDGVKLGLCRVARRPGALDPVKDRCRRSRRRPLRRARGVQRVVRHLAGSRLPRFLCRAAPRLAHAFNDATPDNANFLARSGRSVPATATSPALRARSRRRWPHSAGPHHVMHITFSRRRGRWRSLADACGLWRTSATARHGEPPFASRRH